MLRTKPVSSCPNCGQYMSKIPGVPEDAVCWDCRDIGKPAELTHSVLLRCPKCRHTWDPRDTEDYQVFEDEEHKVWCSECNHTFVVSTSISYSFTSPELLKEPDNGGTG